MYIQYKEVKYKGKTTRYFVAWLLWKDSEGNKHKTFNGYLSVGNANPCPSIGYWLYKEYRELWN